MNTLFRVSIAALALAGAASPAFAQVPAGTGVFAIASTLPFHAPDFRQIHDADFQPAIEQGIAIRQAEVRAISDSSEAPTFVNTIEALERSGQMLDRVTAVFGALTAANTNDKLDAIDTATSPKLAARPVGARFYVEVARCGLSKQRDSGARCFDALISQRACAG